MALTTISWAVLASLYILQIHYINGNELPNSSKHKICHISENDEKITCKGFTGETLSLAEIHDQFDTSIVSNVQKLEFRHGRTPIIRADTFKHLQSLTHLILQNMSITTLEPNAFLGLNQIKLIDLSHNDIKSIPSTLFESTSVRHLGLKGNPSLVIPTNSPFLVAKRLQSLSLSHCGIQHLAGVSFSGTPHIMSLDLSHNRLEQLPEVVFDKTSLSNLDLSFNNFKTLGISVFKRIPYYPGLPKVVFLHGNSWNCDCRLAELVTWLTGRLHNGDASHLPVKTVCSTPSKMAGKAWNDIMEWNCNI